MKMTSHLVKARTADIVEEELLVIRSYIEKKSPPFPKPPTPVVPAKDSNGPLLTEPPAVNQLLLVEDSNKISIGVLLPLRWNSIRRDVPESYYF
ncbi:hypothetical protein ACLOJK_038086 [Asimina triloba]